MALPGNVSTGIITGTFLAPDGEPVRGSVRFTAEAPYALDAAANVILVSLSRTVSLDAAGQFSITLVATDDADLVPLDFTYRVRPMVNGLPMSAFSIEVPGGSSQDLADIAPAPGSGGTLPEGELDSAVADLVPGPSATHDALVDLIADEAPGAAVTSVNGHTGVVVLVKSDLSLGNVNNTSDASKPVSTATQAALDAKSDVGHTHPQSDVTGLSGALAAKANTSHTHAAGDVTSGTIAVARIGSGSPGSGKYVDGGTGAWTDLPDAEGGAGAPQLGSYPASEYGMFTSALDPQQITEASTVGSGNAVRLPVWAGWQIEGIRYYIDTSAGGESGLSGFAIYEDDGDRVANTTGTAWASTGWRSLALNAPVAAEGIDRMVTVAFEPGGVTPKLLWRAGATGFGPAVNGGNRRRTLFGLSFGGSWPSTFDFSTGGGESTWLPLIGLYGTKT